MLTSVNHVGLTDCIEIDRICALVDYRMGFDWQWTDDVVNGIASSF